MAKGQQFERDICRALSRWWSDGTRDDLFWRTSNSGGRAKTRSKTGQRTFGQYGDIGATDPDGFALLRLCTIELKRGYSRCSVADLIDKLDGQAQQEFEKFILKAIADHRLAGSFSWMLIVRRDRRQALVVFPSALHNRLVRDGAVLADFAMGCPFVRARVCVDGVGMSIRVMSFANFVANVEPRKIS